MTGAPLPPPRGAIGWLGARARPGVPGRPTALGRLLLRTVGLLARLLWPTRLAGAERLADDRPVLVVANHSGGGVVEVLALARALLDRPGGPPRLTGMAHPIAFFIPGVAQLLRSLGAIPSTYEHALAALRDGVSVLVFPGGDHDAFRPIWQAGRVDFHGRQGFLRLARAAGVPIVPLGIWGSHFTLPILWRSGLLPFLGVVPRLAGLKRLPITITWLLGAGAILLGAWDGRLPAWAAPPLLAAWTTLPLYLVPFVPWPIRMRLAAPIEQAALPEPGPEAYEQVVAAVQRAVDEARADRA